MSEFDFFTPLKDEEKTEVINLIASKIVSKGVETPAVFFLEMHKPLSFLASQAMIVAMPFIGPLLGSQLAVKLTKILMERQNLEDLIIRIEDLAHEKKENNLKEN